MQASIYISEVLHLPRGLPRGRPALPHIYRALAPGPRFDRSLHLAALEAMLIHGYLSRARKVPRAPSRTKGRNVPFFFSLSLLAPPAYICVTKITLCRALNPWP